ncbi:hypothetical protein GCM10008171_23570 [Methylopila jiangsuensis]|uniref:Acyltransferase n=1 Tax=Methylopila jiangsuensis TaxID=586230 RepID=A0A9W6JIZ4_9HYPH|nr:acyltransferase [Methylopila jiangsuensis]MDR6286557.1 acetyltransferase-like isoleucine patch superfamily enzyme [Methylopila jiangsuensis]GLK77103.1 hypothetical protein GCM10008171_23570 [Methylopila jiangsuensis]
MCEGKEVNTREGEVGAEGRAPPAVQPSSVFKELKLAGFEDVQLQGVNLYDLYRMSGGGKNGFKYKSKYGNVVSLKGDFSIDAMTKTNIYFNGRDNVINIYGIKNVFGLHLACVGGGTINFSSPNVVRGLTVMSSNGGVVSIGSDCLISRDVIIYASKAHGLYNVSDGERRFKQGVTVGDHVWLGQGVRLLSGASIGDGSVIGSYSVLARSVPNNCAAAGNPCRVTTHDIFWTDKAVPDDGNYFDMLQRSGKSRPRFVRFTQEGD